jgi:hypothetical protein
MLRLRRLLPALALAAAGLTGPIAGAFADEPIQPGKVGTGTFVASGTKVTTEIGTSFYPDKDSDDYVVDGFAGQTLSVTVAATKGSTLIPALQVIRPDGSILDYADGAKITPKLGQLPGKSSKLTFKLDQTGVWTIRVRGSFPATGIDSQSKRPIYDFQQPRSKGAYSIAVKYGLPPAAVTTNAVPDAAGQYRFVVPAVGGAILNATLKFKGGTPTFVSLTDPAGGNVAGVTTSTVAGRTVSVKNYSMPARAPLGAYLMSFQANPTAPSTKVSFTSSVKLPKGDPKLTGTIAKEEPLISAVNPTEGGPGTRITLSTSNVIDPANATGTVKVRLGRYMLEQVEVKNNGAQVLGVAPQDLPQGTFDVIVTSSSGQAAVKAGAFSRVPPPEAYTIDPVVASAAGGFKVTITGSNFNTVQNGMAVRFRSLAANQTTQPPVTFSKQTADELQFNMPLNLLIPGEYKVQVLDTRTQLFDEIDQTLTLTNTAAINRVTPGLVPILGGDTVYVQGSNFTDTDTVFLEVTPGSGTYEALNDTQVTFVNSSLHQFSAPVRAKGVYRIKVRDENSYETPTRPLAYYSFSDYTLGLTAGADGFDAWTTALADFDRNGTLDLFLARKGGTTKASTSETRVLRQKADGTFEDVTTAAMPAPTSDDDWRADRIWVADVTQDSYPDIVIVTDSDQFPAKDTKSHVRFLVNERRSSALPATERAFRDRTLDLMAPIRMMSYLYGTNGKNDKDDWRGKDMWIGDLDLSNSGPPEILITSDRVFENYYVSCTPYCASPYSGGYTYNFYWPATRMFKWDSSARSGLGRYKYDANFFPRKSGITVAIFNPPPGVTIPTCNGGACRDKVTPFSGQRLAVGPIDLDGRPDIAVLNSGTVQRDGQPISSLQVALNKVNFADGANVTDITDKLTALDSATYFRGDALAIGAPGYPDGNGYGALAIAKVDPTGLTTSALRLIRFKPPVVQGDQGDFQVITTQALPASTANDRFQSSRIAFVDIDADGDQDLVTIARTPPAAGSAFRIFRNEVVGTTSGVYRETLSGLVAPLITANEHYEGDFLAVGDLDNDGALEFVVTRSVTAGATAPHTRALHIEK